MKLFSRKPKKPTDDNKVDAKIDTKDQLNRHNADDIKLDSIFKDENGKKSKKNENSKKNKKKKNSEKILPTETLQDRIKTLRTLCGLSRPKLCAKHNISFSTLRSWENTECQLSNRSLHLLMSTFGREGLLVDEAWLLTGQGVAPTMITDRPQQMSAYSVDTSSNQHQVHQNTALNPIQSEVDAFMRNNDNAQVMMVDQDYATLHLTKGDFVGGIAVRVEDLSVGQVCLALVDLQAAHRSDHTKPSNNKLKNHHYREQRVNNPSLFSQPLQLCQVQRLDNNHIIVALLGCPQTQWHQHRYDIKTINNLYQICWTRYQV